MIEAAVLVAPSADGDSRLAPADAAALAAAITTGARVTAISVGGRDAERTLRTALASGATEAVRIDAAPVDAWVVAGEAAPVVINYDLIVTGAAGATGQTGLVPAYLAEMLDRPLLGWLIDLAVHERTVRGQRLLPRGERARIEVELPTVASVTLWEQVAPVALLRARVSAARAEVVVAPTTTVAPRVTVSKPHAPKPRRVRTAEAAPASGADRLRLLMAATASTPARDTSVVEGTPEEAAVAIADFLQARRLLS